MKRKSVFLILKISQADRGGEFRFFPEIYVKIDMGIDISISIRLVTTKCGKQVRLEKLTQLRLIMQVLVTSSRQDYMRNQKHIHCQSASGNYTL